MNDTTPAVKGQFYRMLMEKSGEERLRMGCSMFDSAKQIVVSSILESSPNISPGEMKRSIFIRFYGQDFSEVRKREIAGKL